MSFILTAVLNGICADKGNVRYSKKANKRVAKVIAEEKKAEAAGEDEKTQDNNEDAKAGDDKAKDEMHLMKKLLIMLRK